MNLTEALGSMVFLFKKRSIEEIKQPQEYYCSNIDCTNEIADFNQLSGLLTEEAYNNLADFYCIDCIIEEKTNV
jgi:hypothetical protein